MHNNALNPHCLTRFAPSAAGQRKRLCDLQGHAVRRRLRAASFVRAESRPIRDPRLSIRNGTRRALDLVSEDLLKNRPSVPGYRRLPAGVRRPTPRGAGSPWQAFEALPLNLVRDLIEAHFDQNMVHVVAAGLIHALPGEIPTPPHGDVLVPRDHQISDQAQGLKVITVQRNGSGG